MLAEWGLDPVYISEHWTDELLELMRRKLIERKREMKRRAYAAMEQAKSGGKSMPARRVSPAELREMVR